MTLTQQIKYMRDTLNLSIQGSANGCYLREIIKSLEELKGLKNALEIKKSRAVG